MWSKQRDHWASIAGGHRVTLGFVLFFFIVDIPFWYTGTLFYFFSESSWSRWHFVQPKKDKDCIIVDLCRNFKIARCFVLKRGGTLPIAEVADENISVTTSYPGMFSLRWTYTLTHSKTMEDKIHKITVGSDLLINTFEASLLHFFSREMKLPRWEWN